MSRWCTVGNRITFPIDEIVKLVVVMHEKSPRIDITFKANSGSEVLGKPFTIFFEPGVPEENVCRARDKLVAAMCAWDAIQRVPRAEPPVYQPS